MTLDELKKLITDQITSTVPDLITATVSKIMPDIVGKAVTDAVTKAIPPQFLHGKDKDKAKDEGDDCEDDAKKALAVAGLPASVRKTLDDAEKNAALVTKFMADQELVEFGKRAIGMGLKKEDGVLMQKAYTGDKAAQKAFEERLATVAKSAAAIEKTAVIFGEFGDNRGGSEGVGATGHDQLMALAKELRKKDAGLTEAQAYAKVMTDPANAEIAKQERDERMAKIHRFQ